MIRCERKCQFFSFFVALIEIWLQNQIERIIPGENKNITSSGCSHCFSVNFRFFGHFRLPEVIETPAKPQFQPLFMSSKRVWANILSGAAMIERLDWILEKKTRLYHSRWIKFTLTFQLVPPNLMLSLFHRPRQISSGFLPVTFLALTNCVVTPEELEIRQHFILL